MIDVRLPLADLNALLAHHALPRLQQQGLRRIDLYPAASSPEVELTFSGDENDLERVEREVRGPLEVTLLALRHRADGTDPRLGPLRFRREDLNPRHVTLGVFDRGARAGTLIIDRSSYDGWIADITT